MPAKHPMLPLAEVSHHPHTFQWHRRIAALVCILIFALVLVSFGQEVRQDGLRTLHHRTLARRAYVPKVKRETFTSGLQKPPVPPRTYTDTPENLQKLADDAIAKEKSVVEGINKAVKPDKATFENTILPYIRHENQVTVQTAVLGLLPNVAPKPEIEKAANDASTRFDKSREQTWLNEGFYKRVDNVYKKQRDNKKFGGVDRQLLWGVWQTMNAAGMNISKGEKRDRYQAIGDKLNELATEFSNVIAEDNSSLWLTPEELKGTQQDVIDSLEKGKGENKGKVLLPVKVTSTYEAVMRYCTNATTRYSVYLTYVNQAPSNVKRLEDAIVLRDERARLLKYKNYAELRIEGNMAETPKAVNDFLDNLQKKLTPVAIKQSAHLKDLKKADQGKADHLFAWDNLYYQTRQDENEYKVDNDLVTEYFPANTTIQAILDLYALLYGLRFDKIDGKDRDELAPSKNGSDLVWHPDVELYAVWNDGYKSEGDQGSGFVGYIYLDLFFRPGKLGAGAFENPIDPGFEKADGSRHYPSCALVTNVQKSTSAKPSLIQRREVSTIMHELGHGMHHLTSRVKYARNHGPGGTSPDFFEAPSQMMENWAYLPEVLKRLSRHWSYLSPAALDEWKKEQNKTDAKQPPERIPEQLVNDVIKNKNAHAASDTLVQVMYGMYDMALHTPETHEAAKAIDTTSLYNHMRKDITKVEGPEVLGKGWHWGHRQAFFTHLIGGYAASYYSYLWSKVYCEDLFYTAFKKDPFSRAAGTRYRRMVLEPGGTKDLNKVLEDFLGHKPSDKAFFEDMDIKV